MIYEWPSQYPELWPIAHAAHWGDIDGALINGAMNIQVPIITYYHGGGHCG